MARRIRRRPTADLRPDEVEQIRDLLWTAFEHDGGGFTEADWAHTVGGTHVVLDENGAVLAHASVVQRTLYVDDVPHRAGYVEGVATRPDHQGKGLARAVMGEVNDHIDSAFDLGALSTGVPGLYERLGWRRWQGPTFVRSGDGTVSPTPEDDGGIMYWQPGRTRRVDPTLAIACEWRPGDVW